MKKQYVFQYTAKMLAQLQRKLQDRTTIARQIETENSETENSEEVIKELEKFDVNITRIDKLYEKLLANGMFYIPLPLIDERLEL